MQSSEVVLARSVAEAAPEACAAREPCPTWVAFARGATALAWRQVKAGVSQLGGAATWALGSLVGLISLWLLLGHAPEARAGRVAYLLPGFVSMLGLSAFSGAASRLRSDAQQGILSLLMFSPTPPAAYAASSLVTLACGQVMRGGVIFAVGACLVRGQLNIGVLQVAGVAGTLLLLGIVMAGAGMLGACLIPLQGVHRMVVVVVTAFGGLASTIYLPTEALPRPFAAVAPWNPLSWSCTTMRALLLPWTTDPADGNSAVLRLAVAAAVVVGGCLLASRRIEGMVTG